MAEFTMVPETLFTPEVGIARAVDIGSPTVLYQEKPSSLVIIGQGRGDNILNTEEHSGFPCAPPWDPRVPCG